MTKIITNHQSRHIVYGYELTTKERKDFDYYSSEELDNASFFRYRGNVYDLGEFMRTSEEIALLGWDGYNTDSYFSAVIVRYTNDMESVVVGLALS